MGARNTRGQGEEQPEARPWDRQPGEPPRAYAKLSFYVQMGPGRTLEQVADRFGITPGRVRELSAKWGWASRALAFDAEAAAERREQERRQAEQAQQRQLRDAVDWQRLAGTYVMSWVRRSENGEFELIRELTPKEAFRLWRVGYRAERRLRGSRADPGEPTDEALSQEMVLEAEMRELRPAVRSIVEQEFVPRGLRDLPIARLRAEQALVRLVASVLARRALEAVAGASGQRRGADSPGESELLHQIASAMLEVHRRSGGRSRHHTSPEEAALLRKLASAMGEDHPGAVQGEEARDDGKA